MVALFSSIISNLSCSLIGCFSLLKYLTPTHSWGNSSDTETSSSNMGRESGSLIAMCCRGQTHGNTKRRRQLTSYYKWIHLGIWKQERVTQQHRQSMSDQDSLLKQLTKHSKLCLKMNRRKKGVSIVIWSDHICSHGDMWPIGLWTDVMMPRIRRFPHHHLGLRPSPCCFFSPYLECSDSSLLIIVRLP